MSYLFTNIYNEWNAKLVMSTATEKEKNPSSVNCQLETRVSHLIAPHLNLTSMKEMQSY